MSEPSPWLVGWKAIGERIQMDASTVAKKARVRRAVSWLGRSPRITKDKLDSLVDGVKK